MTLRKKLRRQFQYKIKESFSKWCLLCFPAAAKSISRSSIISTPPTPSSLITMHKLKTPEINCVKVLFERHPKLKSILISAATIIVYYVFSIALTFYNRYLFLTFKYPLSITVIHLVVKFIIAAFIRAILTCYRHEKRVTLSWGVYMKRIVPTGLASAVDIGLSNWSLQYITISLYTMSKSTVVLFIMFFAIVLKLEKLRWSIAAVISCISLGLFLFTYHSTEFHLFGFILIMIASFHSGIRWTLAQMITQKHELGLSNPIDMIYHIQPGMILFLLPLAVYVEGLNVITTDKFFRAENFQALMNSSVYILSSACLAFLLESSEFLVVTYTSSLTLSVSGIFKEICTIYLAVIWNHNKLNSMNTIGLIVCLCGIIFHVVIKARQEMGEGGEPSSPPNRRNRSLSTACLMEDDGLSPNSNRLELKNTLPVTSEQQPPFNKSPSPIARTSFSTLNKSSDNIYLQQQRPLLEDEDDPD